MFTVHDFYTKDWLSKFDKETSGIELKRAQFRLLSGLEKRMLTVSMVEVFVSRENKEHAESGLYVRRPGSSVVISVGVNHGVYGSRLRKGLPENRRTNFPGIRHTSRWLIFVGNHFVGKWLLRLLDFLTAFQGGAAWDMLVFGGDRAHKGAIEGFAKRATGGKIDVFGDDTLLADAYAPGDVFVADSKSEGFPLALLEAMASGCVPITTPFGGVSDVVEDGRNGFVRESAADVVRSALTCDGEALALLGKRAEQSAAKHSWAKVANAYDELYCDLLRHSMREDRSRRLAL